MQRATDTQKEKECQLCFRRTSVRVSAINSLENFQHYSRKMQIHFFLPAVCRDSSSSETTPMGTGLFFKGNGIALKQPGFCKIFFPVSGWDKNSLPHKPRLTMGVMPEELACLDTAAWYLASLSFIDVSDKRGMSRFFLVSALSGLSPGLLSTRYPAKKNPSMNNQ